MDLNKYRFSHRVAVRDYEVDYQGIVNNANYLHYVENTRHEFCRAEGLTFAEMHRRGIDPVVSKVEIRYLAPLRIGDEFISCLNVSLKGIRFIFEQDIYRVDGTPVIKAVITVACLENGRLSRGEVLAKAFKLNHAESE